ncbi:type II secretion system protein [Filobacillus milosensis]|uniref:Type II secretion system protein n=1 Tax=Filobacillus milosensis TaxID=94137 RepID=A0A4Y8IQ66_9BACI|nr:competence type IV pilus minor pilin ComGD [Filobacillus milosensis]TFB23812.1 type II secretion system protein [Filobacillus milosensis]
MVLLVRNQKGYTLIEMLIVLMIVMMITTISIIFFKVDQPEDPVKQFLDSFEKDIFFMQQYSVTNQKSLSLIFNRSENYYYITDIQGNTKLIIRHYNPQIKVDLYSFSVPFRYNTTGLPLNPGSFFVIYKNKAYKVIFPFGKGRFYVNEL